MPERLSILIVNGHADSVSAFEQLSDVEVTTAGGEGSDAWLEVLRKHACHVLVLELGSKADLASSLNQVERLRSEFPDLSIFVIATSNAPELIIAAMRAGAQEFLSKPIKDQDLKQAVERSRRRWKASADQQPTGKIISVFSKTGGVGVTTLAVNLGVALAQEQSTRVALVDLNLQHGDAACLLDLEPKYSIVDACDTGDQVDDAKLQSCMSPHPSGLSILAVPPHPAESDEVSALQIQSVLQKLKSLYPFVIVDMPHIFEPRVMTALEMSNIVLLATVATIPALRSAHKVLALFAELGYSPDKIRLVINRVSKMDRIEEKDIRRTLDYETFWTLPNNYMATSEALNTGTPLVTQKRLTNVAKSILDMAIAVSRISHNGHHLR